MLLDFFSQAGSLHDLGELGFGRWRGVLLELFPNDFISHRNLALLYQQLSRPADALQHAQSALDQAPEADRAGVQALIDQLQAQLAAG